MRLREKEIVYTVRSSPESDPWSGSIPAGAAAEAFGSVAKENFIARRLLVPSVESMRWCLLELDVRSPEGEITDRLIIDGGVRIGSLTEPGAPEIDLRVPAGSRVRAYVENLEACAYAFRLALVGPLYDAQWQRRLFP